MSDETEMSELRSLLKRQAKALERALNVIQILRKEPWASPHDMDACWCSSAPHTTRCIHTKEFVEGMKNGLPEL